MAKRGPRAKIEKWLSRESLLLLSGWAKSGLSDAQIAKNMGIAPSTLYEWKKKHLEISEALKEGKEVADYAVENALYKSALGYVYDDVTEEPLYNPITGEPILDAKGRQVIATTKIVRKQVQPSNTAQIFWLCNRQSEAWRRNANAAQIELNVPVIFAGEDKLED